MAVRYTYKGLDKVVETYKSLALRYIVDGYSGWKKAPYATGNLYRRVSSFNTAAKMATQRPTKSGRKIELPTVTISLNFAPPGAEYGYYVHEGKGTSQSYGKREYAKLAAEDPQLQKVINDVIMGNDGPVNTYAKIVMDDLEKILKKKGIVK